MGAIPAADYERLRSWNLTIVEVLLSDHSYADQGRWRNFAGMGGFGVHRETGAWHAFSGNDGGISPIALIRFLKGCDYTTAVDWAAAFLAANPGYGTCSAEAADHDDANPASALAARDVINRAVDIANTPAELNLKSRRLDTPFPSCAYLHDARCGEGALIGYLTASGRTAGVELRYIDPDGCDSTVSPKRRRRRPYRHIVGLPVRQAPVQGHRRSRRQWVRASKIREGRAGHLCQRW